MSENFMAELRKSLKTDQNMKEKCQKKDQKMLNVRKLLSQMEKMLYSGQKSVKM